MKTRLFSLLCLTALSFLGASAYAETSFVNPAAKLYAVAYDTREDLQFGQNIAGGPFDIFEVDPTTGNVMNSQTLSPASEVFSLATQPGTGVLYCVYLDISSYGGLEDAGITATTNGSSHLSLGTIDPATGVVTKIADLTYESEYFGFGISGITFDCDGNLYAVSDLYLQTSTSKSEPLTIMPSSGAIFSVNLTTGALTLIVQGSLGQSHNLEHNPEDGLLYHFYTAVPALTSKDSGSLIAGAHLETVDPNSGAMVSIPLTGATYSDIQGVVYAGNGQFVGHQGGVNSFYSITSGGVVEGVGPSPAQYPTILGLAYSEVFGCEPYQPDLLIGKRASNLKKDDFYTDTGKQQTIRGVKLKGKVGKTVLIPVEIQNDGSVSDRIRLRWAFKVLNQLGDRTGDGPRFEHKFFIVKNGKRNNVTNKIQKKGLALEPGEKQRLVFRLKVRRAPDRRVSRRESIFRATSKGDPSKLDLGKAFFVIKK